MGGEGGGSRDHKKEVYVSGVGEDWCSHLFIDHSKVLSQRIFGLCHGDYGHDKQEKGWSHRNLKQSMVGLLLSVILFVLIHICT